MSYGVGCRRGLDPELVWLWLWRRLVATAPIRPLAWESPCAVSEALEKTDKKNPKKLNFKYVVSNSILCLVDTGNSTD